MDKRNWAVVDALIGLTLHREKAIDILAQQSAKGNSLAKGKLQRELEAKKVLSAALLKMLTR